MRASKLLPVLLFLAQLDLPSEHNDFVTCLHHRFLIYFGGVQYGIPLHSATVHTILPSVSSAQVEVCSGCGNLSRGMRMAGWVGKEFDVLWLDTLGISDCYELGIWNMICN